MAIDGRKEYQIRIVRWSGLLRKLTTQSAGAEEVGRSVWISLSVSVILWCIGFSGTTWAWFQQ
jgi:hypothetical protein